jgi:hypothetical protein
MTDQETLLDFLNIPLGDSDAVLKRFAALPGADHRGSGDHQFVFIKGTRPNRIVLIAHADTVWSSDCYKTETPDLKITGSIIINANGGLGADDRAGCAIVWLLRDMGHSILITNGEEQYGIGSSWLMKNHKDIRDEINENSAFALELDRRRGNRYICYDVGSEDFQAYIEKSTGHIESLSGGFTDICIVCEKICGVNLSIGYYNAHSEYEFLVYSEWQNTLDLCRKWLQEDFPRFLRTQTYRCE